MGEPAIPTEKQRQRAIAKAREILADIRDDEPPSYPRPGGDAGLARVELEERAAALDRLVWLLASTLDLTNTALQRACDVADELNGDMGDDEELARRRQEIAELRAVGSPVTFCAICKRRPAVCVGKYEGSGCTHQPECDPQLQLCSDSIDEPACDHCCGHGNEDGHCHELDSPRPAIQLELED